MPPLLMKLVSRLQIPAGEFGSDSTGTSPGDVDVIPHGDVDDDADDGSGFEPTGKDAKSKTDDVDPKPKGKKEAPKAETEDDEPEIDPDDPDGEKAEEEKKAETKKGEGKEARIPLSRHKELLEKERSKRAEAERALQATQAGRVVAQTNAQITEKEDKLIALEASYNKLMADGDVDKATAAMREIRKLDREVNDARSDLKIAAAEARAIETTRYNITLERIEAAYPELNEDHEDFDADKAQDVMDLQASYVARRGMNQGQALQKAVEKLLGKAGNKQTEAIDVTPRVPKDDKDEKEDPAKAAAAKRKADAVKKTAETVSKTPSDLNKQGKDSDRHGGGAVTAEDAMKMNDDEFSKLDERTLARMRGDEL